jgi:hypothetical protein
VSRVVGQDDVRGAQLVDEIGCLGWGRDLRCAVIARAAAAGKEDGHGGQVREDLVLTNLGVLGSAWFGAGGGGVAVAASVGGLAVGPG